MVLGKGGLLPSSGEEGTGKTENSSGDQETNSQHSETQNQEDKSDSVSGDDLESDSTEGKEENPENLSGSDHQVVSGNGDASEKAEDLFSQKESLKQILESSDFDWPEDLFESVAGELESWSYEQSAGFSAVTTIPGIDEVVINDKDRDAAKDLLWKVKSESAQLAAQLTGLVQAKTLTRDRIGKRGMRIEGKRLHRIALDDGRLFKRRSESIEINATVHISLDISASMASRMPLAREAVLALIMALKPIKGVSVTASAYPGTLTLKH